MMKPPSTAKLRNRHRRLCSMCLSMPLITLTSQKNSTALSTALDGPVLVREPCSCAEFFYLCQNCAHGLIHADQTYKGIWHWRTRYSTYLGGLGTGIGEGNEGVKCGRGEQCLAAKDIEVEVDCPPEEATTSELSSADTVANDSSGEEGTGETSDKPGYLRQEIEGIGGVVKHKVKLMVRIGKTVKEYDDEREKGSYLEREMNSHSRSWCGWCNRVILGDQGV